MSLSEEIREQLIRSFRVELAEHVQVMTDGLLALEQESVAGEQRREVLENVFRAAHSLKGAARAVGVTVIEQLAHALEGVLDGVRRGTVEPAPALYTICYQALDAIRDVLPAYEAGETTPPVQALQALAALGPYQHLDEAAPQGEGAAVPTSAAGAAPPAAQVSPLMAEETIRVGVDKLDALMAQLTELLVAKIRGEQHLMQVHYLQELVAQWQREWLAVRSAYGRLARQGVYESGRSGMGKDVADLLGYVDAGQERLQDLGTLVGGMARDYANDMLHLSLVIDGLEEEIKRVRMLPLNTITGPFGRMVRDLAREAGKEASLRVVGGETELDKRVLEQIKDPLIHLLRNAVDHGIELPEEREAAGKPRSGTITLAAEQLGKDVVICVADDGAGLDLEAIRLAVARDGQIDGQSLTDEELVEAIFRPGVSTSRSVTDLSGRGMGLDVVRRNVEALQGRVQVEWGTGGVSFMLVLPLRLTSSRALMVWTAGELFAIPLGSVERIIHISPQDIAPLGGYDAIRYHDQPVPLVWLCDVLALPRADTPQPGDMPRKELIPVVVLSAAERRVAFAVDALAGEQEVVIKGLGKQLVRVGGVAGATIMGSGEVVLILHAADLVKLGMGGGHPSVLDALKEVVSPMESRARRRILIVDDSITTRTLEKNILEAIGYTVQVATDGQEAMDVITSGGLPDLVISDIVMPRMDGFEFTQQIKSDPRTAHVPVILVTSLGSSEDKARGIEVGADAYVVKSQFDQSSLLETIEQLI